MTDRIFEDKRVYWVWLGIVFGAGSAALWELCRGYGHINEFAEAVAEGALDEKLTDAQRRKRSVPFETAEEIISKCGENGAEVLCFRSEGYPERLRRIPNPPPVLFVRGDLSAVAPDRPTAAIVGTRSPTAYSVRVAERLAGELAERGVTVITGIENGIDSVAAEAACGKGMAAAVCGRGIFSGEYAPEQTDKIAGSGAVLSEFTTANEFGRVGFDKRNRILCGLADAVVFIECRADSSGLNNVSHALRLGKPIFAVPPADIYDARFFGQRDLLRSGAGAVFSAEDIIEGMKRRPAKKGGGEALAEIGRRKQQKKPTVKLTETISGNNDTENVKNEQKNSSEGLHKSEISATIDMSRLSETQRKIYDVIKESGQIHMNQLAEKTELAVSELITELSIMRMEGAVDELSGKRYCVKG